MHLSCHRPTHDAQRVSTFTTFVLYPRDMQIHDRNHLTADSCLGHKRYFDDDGNVITTGIPGTLRVSMVFSDESNEETGETEWFNKRERFRNICWNWTCWDMVTNFGFRTLEDGSIEVYHFGKKEKAGYRISVEVTKQQHASNSCCTCFSGEYFHGNLPVVSQIMKLVFKVHARWLAWSTEHHLNHYAFSSETEEEEKLEEESRRNMPFFLLKNYAWSDLMAMLFGKEVKKPSFLLVKGGRGEDEGNLLPIQRQEAKLQISQDIATDRLTTKGLLARHATETPDDVKAVLTRPSLSKQGEEEAKTNSYLAATQAARLRRLSRAATRRRSRLSSNVDVTGAEEAAVQSEPIQQQEDSAQSSSL